MTPETKYKIERCGVLLARSPLAEEIKKVILDNVAQMTEEEVDTILNVLERETLELSSLAEALREFDASQEASWQEIEKVQQALADKMVGEEAAKLTA